MDLIFLDVILAIAEAALSEIDESDQLKKSILDKCQFADDWLQLKSGRVSQRNLQDAIVLAINTSIVRDKNKICEIIATITTLYACNQIGRGADVGGTLLERFGSSVFPHIKKEEIRFAKAVDADVYDFTLTAVISNFDERMKLYDFKNSNIEGAGASWTAVSCFSIQGFGYILLNHGLDAVKAIRRLIGFS